MLVKKANRLDLITLFSSIDGKSDQAIYTEILKKLSWIPCSLAARYRKFENYGDILQIGYMTLFRAIKSYDYTKSSNVVGYIYPWVKTEVRKSAWQQKEYLQKHQLVGDSRDLDNSISTTLEEDYIRSERKKILKNILKKLDSDSKKVVTDIFDLDGNGHKSLRQLAEEMNVSHETVRKLRLSAEKKLIHLYSKTKQGTGIVARNT